MKLARIGAMFIRYIIISFCDYWNLLIWQSFVTQDRFILISRRTYYAMFLIQALAVIEYLIANGSERAVDEIIEHTFQISVRF